MTSKITLERFLTPQEKILLGGTDKGSVDWHKPEAIAKRLTNVGSAARVRRNTGWYESDLTAPELGIPEIVIRLFELDPETGETILDPVVGTWDEEKGEYVAREDLTKSYFNRLKKAGINMHLREGPARIEREAGGENKG